MLNIEVNLPIGTEAENRWMAMWGEDAVVFSLDTIKRIFEENPDEKDVRFNFNCDGGVVSEGFAIYDYIRTSGRNIHCNIEGGCHSMAIVMLLAAPLEHRTAQKHAQSLIHCVRTDFYGTATAEEFERYAEGLKADEEKILDIYADRTGEDKETLRALMHEEKMRDTDFLIEHKFISSVNAYNTNRRVNGNNLPTKNQTTMAKKMEDALTMASNCLGAIKNLLSGGAKNYDHTDADGNVLFSTDAEDDTLEVGMTASPDGTFELPDGRTIVIADGAITEINEPTTTTEDTHTNEEFDALTEQVNNLTEQVNALTEQNTNLSNQLSEAANVITELQSQLTSNYKPANIKRTAPARKPEEKNEVSNEERMNAQRERLGLKTKNNKED